MTLLRPCRPGPPRWLRFDDDGQTVRLRLAHVRQVVFTAAHGEPCALVWSAGDLWEIVDPGALAVLRAYIGEDEGES